MEKRCFVCSETKPLDSFYKHQRMADGHLNKCKDCTKAYVNARRREMPEHVRAIDNARHKSPERKAKMVMYSRKARQNNPLKYMAHRLVQQALKAGILQRAECERCENPKAEAHHPDYSQPLLIMWLCLRCHRLEHKALVS